MNETLTRRGWGAVVIVGVCLLMANQYGARSLNAVVAPIVIALLAAVIQVRRVEKPSVTRTTPEDGFVGETATVTLEWRVDRPAGATVRDRVGEGLSASQATIETTIEDGATHAYELSFERRGAYEIGPLTVAVRDVLGLVERVDSFDQRARVVVYPRVHELVGTGRHELRALVADVAGDHREEFDQLREYERGDALRDIHWKSTAKRAADDLVVKQFVADEDRGEVVVAAEADAGADTDAAEAAASVVTFLLDTAVDVGLRTPDEAVDASTGTTHHRRVLASLATLGPGRLADLDVHDADVHVHASHDGATVVVGGESIPFDHLRGANERRRPELVSSHATPGRGAEVFG